MAMIKCGMSHSLHSGSGSANEKSTVIYCVMRKSQTNGSSYQTVIHLSAKMLGEVLNIRWYEPTYFGPMCKSNNLVKLLMIVVTLN